MQLWSRLAYNTTRRPLPENLISTLEQRAQKIRQLSIAAIYHAGSGHPGGSLSAADMLACLYGAELNVTPSSFAGPQPNPDRDRFILSKGHAVPALYAAGAVHGFIDYRSLVDLRRYRTRMQGHPHVLDTPFVETSTGSLGQGFSVAIGVALGLRHQERDARSYVMLGDGELQEGEVWEGAMCAAHHHLDNLCALIDYNKLQSDDLNANIMGLEPLADKWRSFGWLALEIDGNSVPDILGALKIAEKTAGQPTVIIAHTIKGKGVGFMEGKAAWHGSVKLSPEDTRRALKSLSLPEDEIERWINGDIQ
jgi:transketolase